MGAVGTIVGESISQAHLQTAMPNGAGGNYYVIGKDLYAFDEMSKRWINMGPIGGPTGDTGPKGVVPSITVTPGGNWSINGFDTGVPTTGGGPSPTLSIGPNGNWFVNGVDTGVPSRGPQGDNGGVSMPSVGQNGNWIINGVDSGRPARGLPGLPGPTGVVPTASIGSNGNWIVDGRDSGVSARSLGDTGSPGPTGTLVGSYNSVNDLRAAHPTGIPGEHFLINRDVYGFDPNVNSWQRIGPLGGPTGPAGLPGASPNVTVGPNGNFLVNGNDSGVSSRGVTGAGGQTGRFVGSYPTPAALQIARPTGAPGEYYLINRRVYGYDPTTGGWRDIGPLGGPPGPQGPQGPAATGPHIVIGSNGDWFIDGEDTGRPARGATGEAGTVGAIMGSYPSQAALQAALPNGPAGMYNLVGNDLYGYDPNTMTWFRIGPVGGPTGPNGPPGTSPALSIDPNGNWIINNANSGLPSKGAPGPKGPTGTIKGSYPSPFDLQTAKPSGPPGDFYLINGDIYSFDPAINSWKNVGPIMGPTGPAGGATADIPVTIGPNGNFFASGNDTGMTSRGAGTTRA